jgi:hypothetical protein
MLTNNLMKNQNKIEIQNGFFKQLGCREHLESYRNLAALNL